jgi:hypothetical protein
MTLWNIYQHAQIKGVHLQQLSTEHDRMRREQRVGGTLDDLTERVDRLVVLVEALWRVACEFEGFDEAALVTKLQEVLEERTSAVAADTCGECGSKVAPELDRCTYCGTAILRRFDPFNL